MPCSTIYPSFGNFRVCLVPVFEKCFLVLKNKEDKENIENVK